MRQVVRVIPEFGRWNTWQLMVLVELYSISYPPTQDPEWLFIDGSHQHIRVRLHGALRFWPWRNTTKIHLR